MNYPIENRFILTVVGKDHPGIVAGISNALYKHGCNIQEISQTVLSDEFAMILLLQTTRKISVQDLNRSLKDACETLKVTHTLRPVSGGVSGSRNASKGRLIITVIGADKIGIVAGVTNVLGDMNINIAELSTAPSYMIEDKPQYTMIARVEIDDSIDISALRSSLEECAKRLSVDINVQSQEIFDVMHKI
ncbi:ACT domain-containing protein [Candidatus Poribacteria bacterium]|nr:ACT domain-containing protein [Candidatus Poribacteria bacterium]